MAGRQLHRLNALGVARIIEPGYHADGGGLYLQISTSGSRSWIFLYSIFGRRREMGLGPLSLLSLAAARKEAADCRQLVKQKIDPIEARKKLTHERRLEAASANPVLFREAAKQYIADHKSTWKNKKHAQQWENTLKIYAFPVIGDVDVRYIDTPMIVQILQPIWTKKAETASRVRGRIKAVLDAQAALGNRDDENPARFVDHLDKVLPRRVKRLQSKHHPALAWEELPAFVAKLGTHPRRAARMMHLLILTAVRTNEARFAHIDEFDLSANVWTIPGGRTKNGMPLRVPLSADALAVVKEAMKKAKGGWLFPGFKDGKPLSDMAMLTLLRRMKCDHITVHGFRSTFRDWVADCTDYPDSLAEMALSHIIKSPTEAAYRRRDMLERRRPMMEDWAQYCASHIEEITPLALPYYPTAA